MQNNNFNNQDTGNMQQDTNNYNNNTLYSTQNSSATNQNVDYSKNNSQNFNDSSVFTDYTSRSQKKKIDSTFFLLLIFSAFVSFISLMHFVLFVREQLSPSENYFNEISSFSSSFLDSTFYTVIFGIALFIYSLTALAFLFIAIKSYMNSTFRNIYDFNILYILSAIMIIFGLLMLNAYLVFPIFYIALLLFIDFSYKQLSNE